jgi:hypothetical protein
MDAGRAIFDGLGDRFEGADPGHFFGGSALQKHHRRSLPFHL